MTREEIELLVDEKGISAIDILNHSVRSVLKRQYHPTQFTAMEASNTIWNF